MWTVHEEPIGKIASIHLAVCPEGGVSDMCQNNLRLRTMESFPRLDPWRPRAKIARLNCIFLGKRLESPGRLLHFSWSDVVGSRMFF